MKFKILLVAAAVMTASGCATILTEDTHQMNVSSSKKDLQVEVDNKIYTAPGIVDVKKENKNKILKVITPGCEQTIALNKEVEPTFFVNILSGGAFGSTTDLASEKMWRYQDSVSITCAK